jgi:hypothetical protein
LAAVFVDMDGALGVDLLNPDAGSTFVLPNLETSVNQVSTKNNFLPSTFHFVPFNFLHNCHTYRLIYYPRGTNRFLGGKRQSRLCLSN